MNLHSVDELEVELATGHGIAVIVEGQTYADDPFYYGQWFDARRSEISFFPQNGWRQVLRAVAELRERNLAIPVYGIIDRDFCEAHQLDADFAERGILRSHRFTLENYLLEPEAWAEVFRFIFRPMPAHANGWNDAAQVTDYIKEAYRNCFVLSAHNQINKFVHTHHSDRAANTPKRLRDFLDNPQAIDHIRAEQKLKEWQEQLGIQDNLVSLFNEQMTVLKNADLSLWQQHVSGKYVLETLRRQFPKRPGAGQFDLKHYLNEYLRALPAAPHDLTILIDRIIAHAAQFSERAL